MTLPLTAQPSIRLDNVSLTLAGPAGPVNILTDINLRLMTGESLGLVGPSGSGKSSLLMLMAGLERATSGHVIVDGFDLSGQTEDRLARFRRDHLGIVFQAFHLLASMTALENVAIPLELAGHAAPLDEALTQLRRVGLGERADHYPGQLSGGEQQRVALARAFAMRPQILLADEPTGNLDQKNGHLVMELLFALQRENGASLLLITHDPALAARCDRLLRIEDGRLQEAAT